MSAPTARPVFTYVVNGGTPNLGAIGAGHAGMSREAS